MPRRELGTAACQPAITALGNKIYQLVTARMIAALVRSTVP